MTKRKIIHTEQELLKDYPIKSNIDGWYFSITQLTNFVCLINAKNSYGFQFSSSDSDGAEFMIEQCEQMIRRESLEGGMYFVN